MIILILLYILFVCCVYNITSKINRKKVCIFYTEKNYSRIIKLTLYLKDNYNFTTLENVKSTDVIIPIDVKSQTLLYKNTIYDMLDDKKVFYEYLKRCDLKNIRLINSYDSDYKGEDIYSEFIIKPSNEYGSKGQMRKKGYIREIIAEYANNNQIQDIINIRTLYEVNFSCKKGDIVGKLCCVTHDKHRKSSDYKKGVRGYYTLDIPYNILTLCENIINRLNYTGLIEFEFIEDENGTIYIMECNPRMSGHIDNPLYFKLIIEPYFHIKSSFVDKIIQKEKLNEKTTIFNFLNFVRKYISTWV